MDSLLHVVRGRKVIAVEGSALRRASHASQRVVVDLGTGDGRWVYRQARVHPDWCCIGVDANAASMRESSWRATRKIARGGAPNAWFILASVESLPEPLFSIADEIHVQYPWGSLRRMLLDSDENGIRALARIGKPGGTFRVTVNLLTGDSPEHEHIRGVYTRAGLDIQDLKVLRISPDTSWGKRLGHGSPRAVLAIDAVVGLKKLIVGRNPYDGYREPPRADA